MPKDEQNTQPAPSNNQGQGTGNSSQQPAGSKPINTDRGGNPNAATENRGMFSEHIEKKTDR
jgi:hypothetical protein